MTVIAPERPVTVEPTVVEQPPVRRTGVRALVAFWALAVLAATVAAATREPLVAAAGVVLALPLVPRLDLRERGVLILNAAVLATLLVEGIWVAMAVATLALLVVPGLLLLEATGLARRRIAQFPPYLPAASVVAVATAALVANFVGPATGVAEPLSGYPLLLSLDAVLALLALAAALRTPGMRSPALPAMLPRVRDCWPLLLPAAVAVGAGMLDASGDNRLTVAVLAAGVGTLAVGAVQAARGDVGRAAIALFGATLAFIYSYTLPGAEIFGWDITGEYGTLNSLLQTGHWPRLHEGDAYGAMLSLTLVPAALHALGGLSPAIILKVVYPALLALFPVCVFLIAARVVSARSAYVAGLVIVAQAAFIQQLPAIARQEMALLEFAALLAVLTDRHLAGSTRRWLLVVFGSGLVVSHYSTAYTTIALLGLGLLVAVGLACLRRRTGHIVTIGFALLVVAGAAAVWYGPVTRSYSNASTALDSIAADGLHLLPSAAGKNPLDAYLRGNVGGPISASAYETAIAARYAKERSWIVPLPAGTDARYRLRDDAIPAQGNVTAGRLMRGGDTLVLQLVNLLSAVGVLILALNRRSSPAARLIGALGVGAIGLLVVARISGTVAVTYNLERLSVQALAVTGVGLAFLLDTAGRSRLGRLVGGAFVAGVVVVILIGSGLGSAAIGSADTANLYRSGEDYERFSISTGEQAAAQWLGTTAPAGAVIYADRYAQLRLFAFANRGTSFLNAVTPRTLDQHGWVYASRSNWVDGRARDTLGPDLATFAFPRRFLDAQYDRWYVSQHGAVYRR